jgi:hypothetical protein
MATLFFVTARNIFFAAERKKITPGLLERLAKRKRNAHRS